MNKKLSPLANTSQKTEVNSSTSFLDTINHDFLEIDHQINQAREKCEAASDSDKAIYIEDIKRLKDQREQLRHMLDTYKTTGVVNTEQESLITKTWQDLKSSITSLVDRFKK